MSEQQDGSGRLVLVGRDLVLDVPGPVGVLQGVEGLHEVSVGRGHAGDHHGAAVATERVLQQPESWGKGTG